MWQCGGLGGIALAWMLGKDNALAGVPQPRSELNGGLHHRAKARRIIQLFMNGGVSQCDTFDFKPALIKCDGQKFELPIADIDHANFAIRCH